MSHSQVTSHLDHPPVWQWLLRHWQWLTRAAWLVLAGVTLALFAVAVPAHLARIPSLLTPLEESFLAQFNLSAQTFAMMMLAMELIVAIDFVLIAAFVFWRKSNDGFAIFVSLALLLFGATIFPVIDALAAWQGVASALRVLAVSAALMMLYLFPDGCFAPSWTRGLALTWVVWILAYYILPSRSFDFESLPTVVQSVASFVFQSNPEFIAEAFLEARRVALLIILFSWFATGLLAQMFRYAAVSSPAQQQQTKWVVLGFTAAVGGAFVYYVPPTLFAGLRQPGTAQMFYAAAAQALFIASLLTVPISLAVSIGRYRLWDVDALIHRTVLYGTLTGSLAITYFATAVLLQSLFRTLTGQSSDAAIVASTLAIAALSRPLRARLQHFIDRRFYREKVDFQKAINDFAVEIRTIIDLRQLQRALVDRIIELLHITHGALYLIDADGQLRLAAGRHLPDLMPPFQLLPATASQLQSGEVTPQPDDALFRLLVPLISPRPANTGLLGVLALGGRLSGQGYSIDDRALLKLLAGQAGTALYVAQLIEEQQAEERRRELAERRLEAHRASPIGRAEAFAAQLTAQPTTALVQLHSLAQDAGRDHEAAALLENLPRVLANQNEAALSQLAEGFNFIAAAEHSPELLSVGLRTLLEGLSPEHGLALQYAADARHAYAQCQQALNPQGIADIAHFSPLLPAPVGIVGALHNGLVQLDRVAQSLRAFERMDAMPDRLAYLASAVEQLQHVEQFARGELTAADRPLVRRIADNWLTVVTRAISELQTRARLTCHLLTRRVLRAEQSTITFQVQNIGLGAAQNIRVTLSPSDEYEVLQSPDSIGRLAPGDDVQAGFEVQLRPGNDGTARIRAHITYDDPRGENQSELFADVVRLLTGDSRFIFIPNPYVVGTPLQTGSPLFVGRSDVVDFVRENLAAAHRNNLVLIGHRRTGKTSLLKQLPGQLNDSYMPVFLDGQSLGLDPGLPNFLHAVAVEIAFALEARGFQCDQPEVEQFAESPANTFEHSFLAAVRRAIGGRHLLLLLDEFEELETATRRGNLDPALFGFLRHLIQHAPNLSMVFCGTHRLEELTADYWSVLFNISLYRHIGYLTRHDAERLIQEPVADFGMRYDDLALEKMWRVTAGHPYFLQLLCHGVVNQHNRKAQGEGYVTIADLNAALDDILASGEAHFVYLWTESRRDERLALTALSRMSPGLGQATSAGLADYLRGHGAAVERRALSDALHRLTLRDILQRVDTGVGDVVRWKLGLLGLWIERYKSLSRVLEEHSIQEGQD